MKIAYISDVVYPFVKGGAEKRIYEMGKRLAAHHEVHIFGMKWWKGEKDIDMDGMTLHGICKPSACMSEIGDLSRSFAVCRQLETDTPLRP